MSIKEQNFVEITTEDLKTIEDTKIYQDNNLVAQLNIKPYKNQIGNKYKRSHLVKKNNDGFYLLRSGYRGDFMEINRFNDERIYFFSDNNYFEWSVNQIKLMKDFIV